MRLSELKHAMNLTQKYYTGAQFWNTPLLEISKWLNPYSGMKAEYQTLSHALQCTGIYRACFPPYKSLTERI